MKNKNVWTKIRVNGGKMLIRAAFQGASQLGRLHPSSRYSRHGVEVLQNIPYDNTGMEEHLLDVYRPIDRPEPLPVVIYVHGGAFQILSKETHWLMGLLLARQGYVVFNINYRLAPQYRYPAGLQDAMNATLWIQKHAHEYGGNPNRLILSGESAGANLVTSLTLASHYRETEDWAKPLWNANLPIECVLPICGILQVSDAERFMRRKKIPSFVADRIRNMPKAYLPRDGSQPEDWKLLDPLLFLERSRPPDRALPAFFTAVGTKDPILDDSRRLKAALDCLNVPCEIEYYPGEVHAFHALSWRKQARKCWKSQYKFLDQHAPTPYQKNKRH